MQICSRCLSGPCLGSMLSDKKLHTPSLLTKGLMVLSTNWSRQGLLVGAFWAIELGECFWWNMDSWFDFSNSLQQCEWKCSPTQRKLCRLFEVMFINGRCMQGTHFYLIIFRNKYCVLIDRQIYVKLHLRINNNDIISMSDAWWDYSDKFKILLYDPIPKLVSFIQFFRASNVTFSLLQAACSECNVSFYH